MPSWQNLATCPTDTVTSESNCYSHKNVLVILKAFLLSKIICLSKKKKKESSNIVSMDSPLFHPSKIISQVCRGDDSLRNIDKVSCRDDTIGRALANY